MAFTLNPLSIAKQVRVLAAAIPTGLAWGAKQVPGSNVYLLLAGLAAELVRLEATQDALANDFDITQTLTLLDKWEESVGIPDACFDRDQSLEQRRKNVITKLTQMRGAITREDFVAVAEALGFTVTIQSATASVTFFPLLFPTPFSAQQSRFTMLVSVAGINADFFPLLFPAQFSEAAAQVLQCVIGVITPINVQPVFEYP